MSEAGLEEEHIEVDPPSAPDPAAKAHAEAEEKASRLGWRPQSEYRGAPGQWRTAEEFLKRGDEILPMVRKDLMRERERNNNMEAEIKALRDTVDDQKKVMEDLMKMAKTASEAGYKRALEDLKNQRRQAAQAGDTAAVVGLSEKIEEVQDARAEAMAQRAPEPKSPPASSEPPKPNMPPEVRQFMKDNPWFNVDPVLNQYMQAEHVQLLQEEPGLSLEENLEKAKEAVMARFPQKFAITPLRQPQTPEPEPEPTVEGEPPVVAKPPRASAVSPPSPPAAPRRQAATGINSIQDPAERAQAKQAFERAKRLMPGITEADWFTIYENPKADIMDIMHSRKESGRK